MKNEIEQIAQQNDMSIEFVTWFFNEKKVGCGNVWFMMMAAMWEGWKGRSIEMDKLAAENARYSMSAGHADQRMAESRTVRSALGFKPDADDVSPSDLVEAINQIVAELCVIRTAHPQPLGPAMDAAIDAFNAEEMPETGMLNAHFILRESIRIKTPATDRIVAGIKADGASEFISRLQQCVDEGDFVGDEVAVIVGAIDCGKEFCEQLREGAK